MKRVTFSIDVNEKTGTMKMVECPEHEAVTAYMAGVLYEVLAEFPDSTSVAELKKAFKSTCRY